MVQPMTLKFELGLDFLTMRRVLSCLSVQKLCCQTNTQRDSADNIYTSLRYATPVENQSTVVLISVQLAV